MSRRSEQNSSSGIAHDRRAARNDRVMQDLERYGGEILHSGEMEKAFQQTHHNWSTVGEHTLRVAKASLAMCYLLHRLHIKTDIPDVVKALSLALLVLVAQVHGNILPLNDLFLHASFDDLSI